MILTLTPDEASAAADCVAAMLEDFANLDPSCPLMVWAGPATFDAQRPVNEPATQARVAAARVAVEKLYAIAHGVAVAG